jgi:uncharacterized protein YqgC (DUF456 family)
VLLSLLGVVIVLVGLAGLILPALPGMPLIFAGIVVVAWADGFARIGVPTLIVSGVLAAIGSVFDYTAGLLGAKRAGASRWGLAGAVIGLIVGVPFGLIGLVLGPGVGAVLFEYARDTNIRRSARAGVGVLIGFVLGTALKYALAMTMIGLALFAYLW